jgi:hypothetical protein
LFERKNGFAGLGLLMVAASSRRTSRAAAPSNPRHFDQTGPNPTAGLAEEAIGAAHPAVCIRADPCDPRADRT